MEKLLLDIFSNATPHWFSGANFTTGDAYYLLRHRDNHTQGGKPAVHKALLALKKKGTVRQHVNIANRWHLAI